MDEEEKKPAKEEEPKHEAEEQEALNKKAQDQEKQNQQGEDANKQDDATLPPPPPPPQEVVLKVFMHCEGCAKKVRRSLKGYPGVEDVITDCKSHIVVVKGEKADPVKVTERIQNKSRRKVELISPIPRPPAPEDQNSSSTKADEEKPKPEPEKKNKDDETPQQQQVITVVLKVHMHCDACSLAIKKRILKMKGVESVETDLQISQVTVVGVMDAEKLVDYLYKRTGKQASVVKQDPPPPPPDEKANKDLEEKGINKLDQLGDKKELEKVADGEEAGAGEKKEADGEAKEGDKKDANKKGDKQEQGDGNNYTEDDEKMKLIAAAYNYAPGRFAMEQYYAAAAAHPPQLFSDENPNACSIM